MIRKRTGNLFFLELLRDISIFYITFVTHNDKNIQMKKTLLGMLLLLTGSCLWVSCSDENEPAPQETLSTETIYANMLGKDIMSQLYYWNEDIAADLVQWDGTSKPMKTLSER